MDSFGGLSTGGWVATGLVGGVLGVLLAALLLRSACDLCGIDPPPSFPRCVGVSVLMLLVNAPIAYGVVLGVRALSATLRLSDGGVAAAATLLDLPLMAAVSTALFALAFRIRPRTGFFVWLANFLLDLLVGSVLFLIALGALTVIGASSRLF